MTSRNYVVRDAVPGSAPRATYPYYLRGLEDALERAAFASIHRGIPHPGTRPAAPSRDVRPRPATAIRYAENARQLLITAAEERDPAGLPGTASTAGGHAAEAKEARDG